MTDENTQSAETGADASQTAAVANAGADEANAAAAAANTEASASNAAAAAKEGQAAASADGAGTDTGSDVGALQKLRETLAGGDEKLLAELNRYKSVEAISKMVREARQAARNAGKPVQLSDKATPEEVKAYREAYGIPDDPTQYPGSFREGFTPTEADTAILTDFKAAMHERNVPPAAAAAALDWYQDFALAQQQDLNANLARVAKETQSALRAEWGGEYDGNIGAAGELMKTHLGDDGFKSMMDMRLMDGSRLQDNAAFVKMMAQIGADYYGSTAIFNGDIEATSKTLQEQQQELLQLRKTDPEKYKTPQVQEKLAGIYAQLDKINARK
jgi:hypothetical protein